VDILTKDLPQEKDWEKFWTQQNPNQSQVSWSKRRIISVLQKYVKKDGKALEAGSGSGFFSAYFCNSGMKTAALDYSDQALAMTQKATAGQAKTVKANLLENSLYHLLSDAFDLVFTDGLFEHFTDAQQNRIMQNLKGVLSEGGVIITVVPNRLSPWELIRPFYMPGIKEVPFQLKELVELNERNGLTVIEKGGMNTVPFRFSPDRLFGPTFGMLLYTVAQKSTRKN
jgi:SAM-dependent methyltransferase